MPAIKLKKVTAEYLAEKEREEKSKEKGKKNLDDVADEENAANVESTKEDGEDAKTRNFLDVEILFDKRKRTLPVAELKLIEWLDSNVQTKDGVYLPLLALYEYYSEVCQMQGECVVDVPIFNRYIRDKFGKCFGFQENSPYRVLIKERHVKAKKPKVQGETLQIKIRDIITNVVNEIGNPRKGLRFQVISKGIVQKYPAQRVDMYPNKLKSALERGVVYGYIERMRGVGMCGYYRVPGEPTKEEPEEKKDKKKKAKVDEKEGEQDEAKQNGEAADSEDKSTDDEKKDEDISEAGKKKEGTEDHDKQKRKKKSAKRKKKYTDKWARSGVAKHSDPEKVEDALPLAITFQSDPKEATGGKIKSYIAKYYHKELSHEHLKKALDNGVVDGLWELISGTSPTGRYHLLIETFNPGRSEHLKDQVAQALVACHEPKQASAGSIKKYILKYHPKLNVENRPHLYKHALVKAIDKGTLRQLSGIGASGTFQLADQFFPSPAILAGDSSDEEGEDDVDDSDDEQHEYVPRPTKRGRIALKPKPQPAPQPVHRNKPKSRPAPQKKGSARKGTERNAKEKTSKYAEVSSEGESNEEIEEVEYTPKPSKRGGGGTTPAKKTTPQTESKSTSRGRAVPEKSQSGKPKRAAAKSVAIIDTSDESDVDEAPVEYTPRASKSRGGGGGDRQPSTKSRSKPRQSAKRKLVEESDADVESREDVPPPKKQRGKPVKVSNKSDDELESGEETTPPIKQKGKPAEELIDSDVDVEASDEEPEPVSTKKQKGGPTTARKGSKAQASKSSAKKSKRRR